MANIIIEYAGSEVYLEEDRYTLFTDRERVIGKAPLTAARFIAKMTNIENVIVMDPDNDFRCVSDREHMNYLEVFNGYKTIQCGVEFTTKDLIMVIEKAAEKKESKKDVKKPVKKEDKTK